MAIIAGAAVLLLWWPLRERPGLGTVSNVFLVGLSMDATLWLLPHPEALAYRIPLLVGGVVLNGAATGLYISARFGPGPRDGLMTGLHKVTGRSIRLARTAVEIVVLVVGILLGGSAGAGTRAVRAGDRPSRAVLPAPVRRAGRRRGGSHVVAGGGRQEARGGAPADRRR